MSTMMKSLYGIRFLDELSEKKTIIHNLHPLSKLLVTTGYLIAVISCGKYEVGTLIPLLFYPVITMSLGEIPALPLFKRALVAAPLAIGIGIFNPFFDQKIAAVLWHIPISGGWISFLSILLKTLFTVSAALILIATAGITGVASGLRILRVPKIFVMQLLLTYRYISVLIEEAARTTRAYSLRSPFEKGVKFSNWGSLTGQLLLRTMDRAQRIYQSMCCRGFIGEYNSGDTPKLSFKDFTYIFIWFLFFIGVRYFNLPSLIGLFFTGGKI